MVELGLKAGFIEQAIVDQAFPEGLPADDAQMMTGWRLDGGQMSAICTPAEPIVKSFRSNKLGLLSAVIRRK